MDLSLNQLNRSVLMQWAEGGSLDEFLRARLGVTSGHSPDGQVDTEEPMSRSARIRAFRSAQECPEQRRAQRHEKQRAERGRAVHMLSAEEVKSIFNDVVSGLGFLVSSQVCETWLWLITPWGKACKGYPASGLETRQYTIDMG